MQPTKHFNRFGIADTPYKIYSEDFQKEWPTNTWFQNRLSKVRLDELRSKMPGIVIVSRNTSNLPG